MGITKNCSRFLFYLKSSGISFDKSITLGRMRLYAKKEDIENDLRLFKVGRSINDVSFRDDYSEPLFELLGASVADSLDYSNYEQATIVHDLNRPIPDHLKNKYTAVIDGGTMEHVFNFPVAVKNCMEMLQPGGHYIGITPANNTMGHGFYQFSPELLYNVFSSANGFRVKKMFIYTQSQEGEYSDWYEVMDPSKVRNRVTLVNSLPTYIMFVAQKEKDVPVFSSNPQQSDYQVLWAARETNNDRKAPVKGSRVKRFYSKVMPKPIRIFLRNVYDMFTKEKVNDENLGRINAEDFKKFDLHKTN